MTILATTRRRVAGLLATLSLATLAVAAQAQVMGFTDALNAVRAQQGLGGLRIDAELSAAAQAHAEDMARNGYHSHVGLDGSTFQTRAQRAGCSGGYMSENIAWGYSSANQVFEGWLGSPGHRQNIMGRNYGVYGVGESGGMWVMMFADAC